MASGPCIESIERPGFCVFCLTHIRPDIRVHRIERTLTAQQTLAFTAILSDEYLPAALERLRRAVDGCMYTTTTLRMLAQLQRDVDDPEGADLLERMARQFAELEATQV